MILNSHLSVELDQVHHAEHRPPFIRQLGSIRPLLDAKCMPASMSRRLFGIASDFTLQSDIGGTLTVNFVDTVCVVVMHPFSKPDSDRL